MAAKKIPRRSTFEMLAQMPRLDMAALEDRNCSASAFDLPLESFDDPLPSR